MTTDFVEITKSAQEQFLGALTAVQETVLDTYTKVAATTEKYVPAEFRTPVKDLTFDPKAFVELGFGFTSKLLETQKAFTDKLLAFAPAAPVITTPKAPAAAK